jgi:hypothetical protein
MRREDTPLRTVTTATNIWLIILWAPDRHVKKANPRFRD